MFFDAFNRKNIIQKIYTPEQFLKLTLRAVNRPIADQHPLKMIPISKHKQRLKTVVARKHLNVVIIIFCFLS